MPPTARGQTWVFQPLPVSTVPNTGRNQSDSGYRGLDEDCLVGVYVVRASDGAQIELVWGDFGNVLLTD